MEGEEEAREAEVGVGHHSLVLLLVQIKTNPRRMMTTLQLMRATTAAVLAVGLVVAKLRVSKRKRKRPISSQSRQ